MVVGNGTLNSCRSRLNVLHVLQEYGNVLNTSSALLNTSFAHAPCATVSVHASCASVIVKTGYVTVFGIGVLIIGYQLSESHAEEVGE